MSNDQVSQSEVDALLAAMQEGTLDVVPDEGAKNENSNSKVYSSGGWAGDVPLADILPYDLTSQDRVFRGRLPTLDIIYERFIRLYRISLSNSLRRMASISLISTDLLKYNELINTLARPSCMSIIRSESLKGPGLIVFESKLAFSLVDSFLGGSEKSSTKLEGKEFTRIELSIMQKVFDHLISDLSDAWAPVHENNFTFIRSEVNPQFVGIVPPNDVVLATTFEVELENASGTMTIVIPYSMIEPIKGKLNATFQSETDREDKEWLYKLTDHLQGTQANIKVNLGLAQITVGDLVNLSVGDIIPLTQDADGELDVNIEGVSKFKCYFGISRGNRAIQISKNEGESK